MKKIFKMMWVLDEIWLTAGSAAMIITFLFAYLNMGSMVIDLNYFKEMRAEYWMMVLVLFVMFFNSLTRMYYYKRGLGPV